MCGLREWGLRTGGILFGRPFCAEKSWRATFWALSMPRLLTWRGDDSGTVFELAVCTCTGGVSTEASVSAAPSNVRSRVSTAA